MRVLHLVPDSFVDRKHYHLGSTKDIASRVRYFEDRGIPYDLLPHGRTGESVLDAIAPVSLGDYSHVLIEKGHYARVFRHIRKTSPSCTVLFRGHNAEILHRFDYFRACISTEGRNTFEHLYRQLRNVTAYGSRDLAAAWYSDHVLSISDWDARRYWRLLAGRQRTSTVPFFLTDEYVEALRRARRKNRSKLCVVLGSTAPGPLIEDAVNRFLRALDRDDVRGLRASGWRFVVTGARSRGMPEDHVFRDLGVRRRDFDSPYENEGRQLHVIELPEEFG